MTTIAQCIQAAAEQFGVTELAILSDRRYAAVALPRQVAYWLARETTTASFPRIAKALRRGDHTTIVYGIRRIEAKREADAEFRRVTDNLRAALFPRELYEDGTLAHDPRQLRLIQGGRIAS